MNVNLTADNTEMACTAIHIVICAEAGPQRMKPPDGSGWVLFGVEVDKGTHWVVCYWKRSKITADAEAEAESEQIKECTLPRFHSGPHSTLPVATQDSCGAHYGEWPIRTF